MNIVLLNKAALGIGRGWDYRVKIDNPKSIIVHTTNGRKRSSYTSERDYIYNSGGIGAHFLIGKQGQITQFLDTTIHRAWHAGAVNDPRFNNNNSIGIEIHYTPGEGSWSKAMYDALTWLTKQLTTKHTITDIQLIDMHRRVAIPRGRKIDPSGLTDAEFYVWRSRLFDTIKPTTIKYRVVVDVARIRTSPQIADNIAGRAYKGLIFESDALKVDEQLEYVNGINTWAHLTRGSQYGIKLDGLGFVHTSNLTIIN